MYKYKYNPRDYEDSPVLLAEMEDYYGLLERYKAEKTTRNFLRLDKQRIDLFFSIKHRVVERRLTGTQAQEMRDYFGELFDREQEETDD